MTETRRYWIGGLAMILLGMTLVVAGTGKVLMESAAFNLHAFPSFIPTPIAAAFYIALPVIEITIGFLLVGGIAVKFAGSIAALLIIGFAVSNILLLARGIDECATCFGAAGSFTPISALILDGFMAVLVLIMFLCYQGKFFNIKPWVFKEIKKGSEYDKPSYSKVF